MMLSSSSHLILKYFLLEGNRIMSREELNRIRDDLFCEFCGKQCKSLNSLRQHSTRCSHNPKRKAFNKLGDYSTSIKGKTQYSDERIRKSAQTLRDKYANGYVSPLKDSSRNVQYIHKEHNDIEIDKWLNYISQNTFEIPELDIITHNEGYEVVAKHQVKDNNTVNLTFVHNYIANILLNGNLTKTNTVHHIDSNRANNDPKNLLVFIDNNNHKRFHNSNYAYLTYNEQTHLFSCELVKS